MAVIASIAMPSAPGVSSATYCSWRCILTYLIELDCSPLNTQCLTNTTVLKTAMTQNLQNDPTSLQKLNDRHVFGGMGSPEDVARVAVFLASDDARWVTGVPLPVDGGFLCQ